jgi:glycosyltransferase involved in cell wall biosynthesis
MKPERRFGCDAMKILIAHNRYQFSGGEDAVVRDEAELLRRRGHCVEVLEQDNDAIHGFRGNLIAAASVFYSAPSRVRMKQVIHDFQPEIVHIHNWFPMLSPAIILEADASAIPIVQTLHNFRLLCANALLFRDGAVCTDCVGKQIPMGGILHGCYRGSRAGSAIVAAAFAYHRLAHTWDCVDLFIAVSGFEREILLGGGLAAEKVVVKPNFVASDAMLAGMNRESSALFAGRLSEEKGIKTLLSAWNTGRMPWQLKIIGDGPMADEVRSCAASNSRVEYLGLQPPDAVLSAMAKAKFLVFPSEWYETFGRTVVEAFSQGTPVLATDMGGVRELVEEGRTGFRFPPGDADALVAGAARFFAMEDYEQMRANCRKLFLSRFTAEINYTLLVDIYNRAIALRKRRRQAG